jgi:GT2 family glycosyltransferase
MFTVVIPTMLKFFPFKQFLKTLAIYTFSDKSKIGEIIIINNSEQKDLDKEFAEYKEKIKFLSYGINIGCNPAWNIGVQYAKYDKICLLNDDVIFDLTLFDKLDLLNNLETGIVGLCPGVKDFNQPPFINGEIKILPWNHEQHIWLWLFNVYS